MKKKNIISVLLSIALAFTYLAGCAKQDSEPSPSQVSLSNPDASPAAQELYAYICESYGSVILSGQQESTWMATPEYEMEYIEKCSGKLPAIRGLDYMNADFDGVNRRAEAWHNKGGIVTICWHTGINGRGYNESKEDQPDFSKLLTEGTEEYDNMMKNWDRAAQALTALRDKNIPVLWRPFHEFDGGWFWWGKGGKDNFIKLWQLMYDKFTNEYKLNNLIWVLGYADDVKSGWYPGDEYCDIIGSDTYRKKTHEKAYSRLCEMNTGKPVCFHECGDMPLPSDYTGKNAMWAWFMTWHTDHIKANPEENIKEIYNSELIITLDELPKFEYIKTE